MRRGDVRMEKGSTRHKTMRSVERSNRHRLRQTGILGGQQQRVSSARAVRIVCGSSATVDPLATGAGVANKMGRRDMGPGIRQESSWVA